MHDALFFHHTGEGGIGYGYHFDLRWPCNTDNANVTSTPAANIAPKARVSVGAVNAKCFATEQRADTMSQRCQPGNMKHASGQQKMLDEDSRDVWRKVELGWCGVGAKRNELVTER